MRKLLSIIIPSYNMEGYLPKCLDSVLAVGRFREFLDIIVVNDGSKDRTSEIAHDFERRHPSVVRVIDKSNGHYGSAVNAGLAAATGLFVKNLDADDAFDPKGLAAFLEQIESDTEEGRVVDLYLTNYDHVNEKGRKTYTVSFDLPTDRIFRMEEILVKTKLISMHAITWRRGLLMDVGYHQSEGIAYSDWEWILYPMLQARTIRYLPTRVYLYLLGREGQSVSVLERRRNAGAWNVLLERAFAMCRTQGPQLSPAAWDYLLRVIIGMAQLQAETAFVLGPLRELAAVVASLCSSLESIQSGLVARLEDECRVMKSSLNLPYLRIWRRLPFGKTAWVLSVRGYLAVIRWIKLNGS